MNYAIIGAIILVLYIGQRLALARAQRTHSETWMMVSLAAMLLEVQARAARDIQKAKDLRKGQEHA